MGADSHRPADSGKQEILLEVKHLKKYFPVKTGFLKKERFSLHFEPCE